MALTKISASVIAANAIVAAGVAENSISTSEIATDGVGTLQISDGAVTSGKLDTNIDIAGTLDVTGVLTADSNVVIAGNLTVNGATVTNSSTNTTIADALIELGTGTTGSPANDAGIVIERGDSDNAFIGWDESADTFILGTGSFTGASTGNLTISTAPLSVGTLTASGITFPTSDGSSGQVLKTDGSGNLTFDAQTAVVDNFTATGDGSTTDFDTGINPGDEVNTWVFIDGVYQQKGEYSYSGSTISFSTAPDSGATIDVTTGTVGGFASADSVLGVYETTTTDTDTYATGISASNENNTWVFVGGVYQPKDSYTFSSGTLTFDANTPTGQKLSVTATKSLSAGSVETNSITANAVTSAKIASNSILSRHIANNSIVGADISATTQITASTFTGALTGDVTGNVVGNLTGTIQTAAQTNITSVGTLSALTVSGQLTAGGLSYPTSDGTNEQVLRTDGSGNLSFGTISGTTLNNNTNNYVMTGTGTANTLNGESGLTYDGSTLDVTGTATMDGLVVDGAADIDYQSGATNNTAPDTLKVSNKTTGVHAAGLGASIKFEHTNSSASYSGSRISNVSNADPFTSNLSFYPYNYGYKEAMRIASNGDISFYEDTGTLAKLFWDASAESLGIGTTSLTTSDGSNVELSAATSSRVILASTGTGGRKWTMATGTAGSLDFYDYDASAYRMRIDSSGNVGIGTDSPAVKLHVEEATTGLAMRIARGSNKIDIGGSGSGTQYIKGYENSVAFGNEYAGNTMFLTGNTERMRITADGEFLLNRTGIFGTGNTCTAFIQGKSVAAIYVCGTNTSGYQLITFFNGGLNVMGSITHDNVTVNYGGSSDYRLKENVNYDFDATTRLKQLKPARFNWIADSDNIVQDGFLAHEVQDIVPEAVVGAKDATETVSNVVLNTEGNVVAQDITEEEWTAGKEDSTYDADTTWEASHTKIVQQNLDPAKLVPLLVKTIQELEARITALENA